MGTAYDHGRVFLDRSRTGKSALRYVPDVLACLCVLTALEERLKACQELRGSAPPATDPTEYQTWLQSSITAACGALRTVPVAQEDNTAHKLRAACLQYLGSIQGNNE